MNSPHVYPCRLLGHVVPLLALAAGGLTLVLSGCAGISPSVQTQRRIAELRNVYVTLRPETQERILGGSIECGNTPDVVYMALGKPQKIVTSSDGRKAMWVYVEHYLPRQIYSAGFNAPGAAFHYVPGVAGANTPFHGGAGDPAWQKPLDYHADGVASPETNGLSPDIHLDDSGLPSKTIYVFYYNNRVVEIKLDGDTSDQHDPLNHLADIVGKKASGFQRSIFGDQGL